MKKYFQFIDQENSQVRELKTSEIIKYPETITILNERQPGTYECIIPENFNQLYSEGKIFLKYENSKLNLYEV